MTYYYSTCNECKTHGVDTFSLDKFGGGSYRRPGRYYDAAVCRFCIGEMMEFIVKTESENREVGALIWMYTVNGVRRAAAQIAEQRVRIGDYAFGANDAHAYWGDYKRLNKLMAERIKNETEEYLKGFNSVER